MPCLVQVYSCLNAHRNNEQDDEIRMAIPLDEVRKIAELARLRFSHDELEKMADELEKILKYIRKLEELDTSHVEPMSHVHNDSEALRDDKRLQSTSRDEALSNAPDSDGKYFRVPKVIE